RSAQGGALTVDSRMEQASFAAQGLGQCRALGTKPTAIRGVRRVATDAHRAPSCIDFGKDAAADTAVRARRPDAHCRPATASPKISLSRSGPTSRPSFMSSQYQAPSRVSPYNTAPRSLLFSITIRL